MTSPVVLPRHSVGRLRTGRRQRIHRSPGQCVANRTRSGHRLASAVRLALARLALVHELVKRLLELQDCGLLSTFLAWLLWLLIVHGVPSVSHDPLRTAADRAHAVQRIASRRRRDDGDGQRSHMHPLLKCTPANSLCTKGEG